MSLSISNSLRVEQNVHDLLAPMLRDIEFARAEITRAVEEQMRIHQSTIENDALFEQSIREDIEKDRVKAKKDLAAIQFVIQNKLYRGTHVEMILKKACRIAEKYI